MRDKSARLHPGLLLFHQLHIAVVLGPDAHFLLKQHTERTYAFEAHFIAYVRNGNVLGEQFLGFIKPFARKILVRRFAVNAAEQAVEVKTRKTGPARNAIEVNGFMEILVHEQLRSYNSFVYVWR